MTEEAPVFNIHRWKRDGKKPEHYPEVVAIVERIGIPGLLRCLGAYGDDLYEQFSEERYAEDRAAEETANQSGASAMELIVRPMRRSKTQLDRKTYLWMYVAELTREAERFEERERLANMSDEEVDTEARAKAIAKLEKELADVKGGKQESAIARAYGSTW